MAVRALAHLSERASERVGASAAVGVGPVAVRPPLQQKAEAALDQPLNHLPVRVEVGRRAVEAAVHDRPGRAWSAAAQRRLRAGAPPAPEACGADWSPARSLARSTGASWR